MLDAPSERGLGRETFRPPLIHRIGIYRNRKIIRSEMTCISIPIEEEMSFDAYDRNFHESELIFFPPKYEGLIPILYRNRNLFLQTKGI